MTTLYDKLKYYSTDLQIGLNLAVLVIPQAIAFSLLAGVPPLFGIYSAIYGVLIVALLNPTKAFHGGPNSAISMAVGVALITFAPQYGPDYMGMMLTLAVMIGIIQLLFASIRPLTRLLDFVSEPVISGIIVGVGFVLIFKSIAPFGGLPQNTQTAWPLVITWHTFLSVAEFGNKFAIEIGFVTLFTAIIAKWFRVFQRWYLIIGLIGGTLYSEYLQRAFGGKSNIRIEQVGNIDLQLALPSIPTLTPETMGFILHLVPAAFAIALLGLYQTASIVKNSGRLSGEFVSSKEAARADGIANIAAGFLSSLPGSGSFNRVAMMQAMNVKSRWASVSSALLLVAMVFVAKDLIAIIPLPAMAALVMMVGANVIQWKSIKHHFESRIETIIFIASFASVHIFGLLDAVLVGAVFALINWVWHKSHPTIEIEANKVSIKGDMYYASIPVVEPKLVPLLKTYDTVEIDLTRMDHLDIEASRWFSKLGKTQGCKVILKLRKNQNQEVSLLSKSLQNEIDRLVFQSRKTDNGVAAT